MTKSFLFFNIDQQFFAVETKHVVSVEDSQKLKLNIAYISYAPVFVTGVVRVRDKIVQVLDMKQLLFNKETIESKASVILSKNNSNVLFLISDMDNVREINENKIKKVDNFSYIITNERMVTILDMNILFDKIRENYCDKV